MIQLRPYQQDCVDRVRSAFKDGSRKVLLVLPTGAGKTICFSFITEGASRKNKKVMILVHRQELLDQCRKSLESLDVKFGIIASGRTQNLTEPIQIASIQTLVRRIDQVPQPDLIIMDEAHHSCAGSWQKVLDKWKDAKVLGVTATPARLDGKGLGSVFEILINGLEVTQLIDQKYLCPPIYFAPSTVDLDGVRTIAGDYDKKEINSRMDKPTITGDAVEHYRRICNGLPAVVFCSSRIHAENVSRAFIQAGFRSAVLDGTVSDADRSDRVKALGDGRLQLLVTIDIVSEGFDLPIVAVAILLRPTQSLSLHLQQIGRVLRTAPNKDRAIILDHVGNCLRNGLAEEKREWSLDGIKKKKKKNTLSLPRYVQCANCFIIHTPADKCPHCGLVREIKERLIEQINGELTQLTVDSEKLKEIRERKKEQGKARSMAELIALGKNKGMKNPKGWAYYVYNARNKNR